MKSENINVSELTLANCLGKLVLDLFQVQILFGIFRVEFSKLHVHSNERKSDE